MIYTDSLMRGGDIIKRLLSILIVFVIFISIGTITVFAKSNIDMSLSAEENIKPGKAFNVFLNISDNKNLGAVYVSLIYDCKKLKLKSCIIENKTSEDYLKYNDTEGEIKLIYMIKSRPSNESIIKFRFEPYQSEETTYHFSSEFYEAVNFKQEKAICLSVPDLAISVSQNGSEITQKTTNNINSKNSTTQKSSKSERSKENKQPSGQSGRLKNTSDNDKSDELPEEETSLTSEQNSNDTVIHEFDVTSHEEKPDDSVILTLIGFAIIVIISVIAARVTVHKLRKKYME